MDDLELRAVAHHEAGHVVVAHVLDCRVDGLELFWSDLGRWFGRSPIRLSKEDLDGLNILIHMNSLSMAGAKSAVAGMLAQAKFLAMRQFGSEVRFDTSVDLEYMTAFLRDNNRTEESPGRFVIHFIRHPGNETAEMENSGLCFSTEDSKGFNYYLAKGGDLDPLSLMKDTMRLLDEPANWKRVETLVSLVLRQAPFGENKWRALTAEQLLEALTSLE